jgi:hypothetical protein
VRSQESSRVFPAPDGTGLRLTDIPARDASTPSKPGHNREEVFEGGDAYYLGPGHTPILYAGTEVVEFSPTEELGRTMEVVTKTCRSGARGE